MTAEHKRRMAQGRNRAARERAQRSKARVQTFDAWCRTGCKGLVPEIPTDHDYAVARGT